MRTRVKRLPTLLLQIPLIVACSTDGTPRRQGSVVVTVEIPHSVEFEAATYLVTRPNGEVATWGSLAQDLAPLALSLPEAPDYLLLVNALSRQGDASATASVECEGFRSFDVFGGEEVPLALPLSCSDIWPRLDSPDVSTQSECGLEALVVAPLAQWTGGSIRASASALPERAELRWSVADEEVLALETVRSRGEEAEFVCSRAGVTSVTVYVSLESCNDEASVEVTCHTHGDAGLLDLRGRKDILERRPPRLR